MEIPDISLFKKKGDGHFAPFARRALAIYVERSYQLVAALEDENYRKTDKKILLWKASFYNFRSALGKAGITTIEELIDGYEDLYQDLPGLEERIQESLQNRINVTQMKMRAVARERARISNFRSIERKNLRFSISV